MTMGNRGAGASQGATIIHEVKKQAIKTVGSIVGQVGRSIARHLVDKHFAGERAGKENEE